MVWGAIKSGVKGAWDGVTGKSKAQTVQAPKMDESRFVYGGGREADSAAATSRRLAGQAAALGAGAENAQRRAGPTEAQQAGALGAQALGQWQGTRGAILDAAGQRGPSEAQAQLQAGQQNAMRQQLALARSGRGGNEAAAMRQAAWNNANITSQTSQAAAQLRAQEQNAQLQREMQALQYVGGQDASLGQFGLQTGMQGTLQQRQLNDARSAQMTQAQMGAQGMQQQVLQSELDANQQYELARTGQALAAESQNAAQVAARGNAIIGGVASMAGGAMGLAKSDERSKEKIQGLSTENAELRRTLEALGGVPDEIRGTRVEYPQTAARPRATGTGAITTADLDAIGRQAIDTIRKAPGYSYEYKEPNSPGAAPGRHVGPMAQDLEQTPLGPSLVREAPDGTKMVDGGRAGMTALAAASEQQKELDELRRQVAALEGSPPARMPRTRTPAWLTGGQ